MPARDARGLRTKGRCTRGIGKFHSAGRLHLAGQAPRALFCNTVIITNMLVQLEGRSFDTPEEERWLREAGVCLSHRHGAAADQLSWIEHTFRRIWADEASHGWNWFAAGDRMQLVGFTTYEQREHCWWWLTHWLAQPDVGIFGPMGVHRSMRGKHVGAILLRRALDSMRRLGLRRAVIPAVGPIGFYERWCGATVVERLRKPN